MNYPIVLSGGYGTRLGAVSRKSDPRPVSRLIGQRPPFRGTGNFVWNGGIFCFGAVNMIAAMITDFGGHALPTCAKPKAPSRLSLSRSTTIHGAVLKTASSPSPSPATWRRVDKATSIDHSTGSGSAGTNRGEDDIVCLEHIDARAWGFMINRFARHWCIGADHNATQDRG